MSFTSLYWCSVSVLAHFTKDMASVLVWLSRSLSLHASQVGRKGNGKWTFSKSKNRVSKTKQSNGWIFNGIKETNREEPRKRKDKGR